MAMVHDDIQLANIPSDVTGLFGLLPTLVLPKNWLPIVF
jgi:hypothetical protein